jgi:hypothetical protein
MHIVRATGPRPSFLPWLTELHASLLAVRSALNTLSAQSSAHQPDRVELGVLPQPIWIMRSDWDNSEDDESYKVGFGGVAPDGLPCYFALADGVPIFQCDDCDANTRADENECPMCWAQYEARPKAAEEGALVMGIVKCGVPFAFPDQYKHHGRATDNCQACAAVQLVPSGD